jgi:biotin carboxyl carrier protein
VPTIKVLSEMNARVRGIEVAVGAEVLAGDTLLILECMKMEIPVEAPRAGRVSQLMVAVDVEIVDGQALVILET